MSEFTYSNLIAAGAPVLPINWSYEISKTDRGEVCVSVYDDMGTLQGSLNSAALTDIAPDKLLVSIVVVCINLLAAIDQKKRRDAVLDALDAYVGSYTHE